MYSYNRRTARHSDPRIYVNDQHIDRFLMMVTKAISELGQSDKDDFVRLNDIARRLEREGADDRTREIWADSLQKMAKRLLQNSKDAHDIWNDLVRANAVIRER